MMIIGYGKSIIEQEARIALLSVGIEYFSSRQYLVDGLYDKASSLITIEPAGLFGKLVIEHISNGDERISFNPADRYPKYSRAYDQSRLNESNKWETREARL